MPACHSLIVISGVFPVQEVGVVGVDLDCVRGLMQVVPPVPEHFNEGQEFTIVHIVKGFTPLCPTWAALVDDGLVAALLWTPPEV